MLASAVGVTIAIMAGFGAATLAAAACYLAALVRVLIGRWPQPDSEAPAELIADAAPISAAG